MQNALTLYSGLDILSKNEKANLFARIGRNVTGLTEIAGLPFFVMAVRLFLVANKPGNRHYSRIRNARTNCFANSPFFPLFAKRLYV